VSLCDKPECYRCAQHARIAELEADLATALECAARATKRAEEAAASAEALRERTRNVADGVVRVLLDALAAARVRA
jgi:hypothetical protein